MPHADVVLFLSVWHHLVLRDGLDAATDQLRAIWDRTERVLFFEAGDEELEAGSVWPAMEPDPKAWLTQYLSEACPGGEIRHLGSHTASDAEAYLRHLFAVLR